MKGMSRANMRFSAVVGGLTVLGAVIGYRLSCVPGLRTYKLVNVGGQVLALMGVLVLSEILADERWKRICITLIAPSILWIQTSIPFGAFVGASIARLAHKPSAEMLAIFALEYWAYSMFILVPLNEVVVFPQLPLFKKGVETRWRWMGFLLVLGGVLAQLIAGIMDLSG